MYSSILHILLPGRVQLGHGRNLPQGGRYFITRRACARSSGRPLNNKHTIYKRGNADTHAIKTWRIFVNILILLYDELLFVLLYVSVYSLCVHTILRSVRYVYLLNINLKTLLSLPTCLYARTLSLCSHALRADPSCRKRCNECSILLNTYTCSLEFPLIPYRRYLLLLVS